MKVVIDTQVVLTAVFFGGAPRQIVEAVARGTLAAYATPEIASEYGAAVAKAAAKKREKLRPHLLLPFTARLHMIEATPKAATCKNSGDDKFLSCALDAGAFYIVGGDKRLQLTRLGKTAKIMTAEGLSPILALCS